MEASFVGSRGAEICFPAGTMSQAPSSAPRLHKHRAQETRGVLWYPATEPGAGKAAECHTLAQVSCVIWGKSKHQSGWERAEEPHPEHCMPCCSGGLTHGAARVCSTPAAPAPLQSTAQHRAPRGPCGKWGQNEQPTSKGHSEGECTEEHSGTACPIP